MELAAIVYYDAPPRPCFLFQRRLGGSPIIRSPPQLSPLLPQMSAFHEVPVREIPQRAREAPREHRPRTDRLGRPPQYRVRGAGDDPPRAESILGEEALGQILLTFLRRHRILIWE